MTGKIKVKDANGNGKLDLFDVIVYFGSLGLNVTMALGTIISTFL